MFNVNSFLAGWFLAEEAGAQEQAKPSIPGKPVTAFRRPQYTPSVSWHEAVFDGNVVGMCIDEPGNLHGVVTHNDVDNIWTWMAYKLTRGSDGGESTEYLAMNYVTSLRAGMIEVETSLHRIRAVAQRHRKRP